MTEIQRYLAEEVAEDLADGIINRREAIRRLGLLGVSGAAASGLLAAFASDRAAAAEPLSGNRSPSETSWAPAPRESITFAGPQGTMMAALTELKRRLRGTKLCAVGYCFGGNMVWRLLTSNEPRLAAGAAYYGPFPEGGDFHGSRAAVLGIYGGLDTRVLATLPAAKA